MSRQSRIVSHRLITGLCLITLPATSALAAAVTDGTTLQVKKNYSATSIGDYPLNAQGQNSVIETGIDGLLFTSDKDSTSAALATDKGKLILNNATLTSSGKVADGVKLDNGILNATGGTITATGSAARGIGANNGSQIMLDNTMVNAAGSAMAAINLSNQSVLEATGARIVAADKAMGLQLKSNSAEMKSSATLKNTTVSSQNSDAIRVMNGDVTLEGAILSSAGANGYALNANGGATINATGGRFQTTGADGDAVWLASADSILTAKDTSFFTTGDNAIAVNAQYGEATLTGNTIETAGDMSYGLYTENKIKGDMLTIDTQGAGSSGVFAARGGDIALSGAEISTLGQQADGLRAIDSSSLQANNVTVATKGNSASGVYSNGSNVTLTDSKLSTEGARSMGIAAAAAGSVAATGVNVTTQGDGASALFTQQGSINFANGELATSGKAAAIQAQGNDSALPESHVTLNTVNVNAAQGPSVQSEGGTLTLDAANSTFNSGTGVVLNVLASDGTAVTLNADNSVLNGSLISDSADSVSTVALNSGSHLIGASKNITSVALDGSSRWDVTANSDVESLSNNGLIAFSAPDDQGHKTLTVNGDYSGNGGTIVFNTLLGNDNSPTDKMIVTGDIKEGDTRVTINNLGGKGDYTVNGIEVVKVGGTSYGTFTRSGRIVAGNYDYRLQKQNQSWYLTNEAPSPDPEDPNKDDGNHSGGNDGGNGGNPPVPPPHGNKLQVRPESGGYLANLMAANTMFATRMQDRLGEGEYARDGQSGHADGLWMRHVGNTTSFNINSDQMKARTNRYVVQLGMDMADWSTTGLDRWHVGGMVGYGNAKSNIRSSVTHYRTDSTVEGYSAGMYATWVQSEKDMSGTYLDSWVLYNWFRNTVNGQGLPSEQYHTQGFTASVEAGYTLPLTSNERLSSWLQPKAQLSWMDVAAKNRREANGTRVTDQNDGMLSSRLGLRAYLKGHSHLDDNTGREFQPFVEANWIHNFDTYQVRMDGINNEVLGTRDIGELKLGVEGKIAHNFTLWGNVAQQMGDDGYADTGVLLGARLNF